MVLGLNRKPKVATPEPVPQETEEVGEEYVDEEVEEVEEPVVEKARQQLNRTEKLRTPPVELEEEEEVEETPQLTEEQEALLNHEKRIQALEAAFFRLKQI